MFGPENERNAANDKNRYPYDMKDVAGNEYTISLEDRETGTLKVTKKPVNESMPPWGHSDLEYQINNRPMNESASHFWKYNEDKILKQLEEYLKSTYSQHYVDRTSGSKEQTLDKIKYNRREGFCAGNVTKYIDRYDIKGTPRADLFKVLHYTMLLINHLDLIENK